MPNRVREFRQKAGLTMRGLADLMDIHFTTLAKIERSERRLSLEWMERIAAGLNAAGFPTDPAELITEDAAEKPYQKVPFVGSIAAGTWQEAVQHADGTILIPPDTSGPNSFALTASGESMNRTIPNGAVVIVDPDQWKLSDGKIYAAMHEDGGATLKRFRADPPRLEPESSDPAFEPIFLGREPISVIGRITLLVQRM